MLWPLSGQNVFLNVHLVSLTSNLLILDKGFIV